MKPVVEQSFPRQLGAAMLVAFVACMLSLTSVILLFIALDRAALVVWPALQIMGR